ncbi:MAG: hypothetical protein N3G22_03035, partial [Candidatus Micrarchaeota archaeon]|nr:hypothetical protein [Candidatus Micrarchaeota archaeon]
MGCKNLPKASLCIFLVFSLLPSLSYPIEVFTDADFPTYLYPSMLNSNTIEVKAVYLNLTYYYKIKQENMPSSIGDFYKPGDYSVNLFEASTYPLANAPIYFTFDGKQIMSDGCYPKNTNSSGFVRCHISHFKDAAGNPVSIDSLGSCGSLIVEFRGMYSGSDYLKPSSASIAYCPSHSSSLSAFGVALANLSTEPKYVALCFPLMLIAGLLITSMFYSGKDPLSLFDLTTPRLPRVKAYRVKAGTAPQMIRSAVRRYTIMQRQVSKDLKKLTKLAAKGKNKEGTKANKEEAKAIRKKIEALLDEFKREVKKAVRTKEEQEQRERALEEIMRRIAAEFNKLKPEDEGSSLFKRWKYTRESLVGLLELYLFAYQANTIMGIARGAPGGRIKRLLDKAADKLTSGVTGVEQSKASGIIGRIPLVKRAVILPGKLLDVFLQARATRRSIISVERELIGAILYYALFSKRNKEDPGGKRRLTLIGKALQRATDGTKLGKAISWWNNWTFQDFQKRKEIMVRKAHDFRNPEQEWFRRSTLALNGFFSLTFNSIKNALPLLSNPHKVKEAAENDLKEIGQRAAALKKELAKAEKTSDAAKIAQLTAQLDGLKKQLSLLMEIRRQVSVSSEKEILAKNLQRDYLDKVDMSLCTNFRKLKQDSDFYTSKIDKAAEAVAAGRISLSSALYYIMKLAKMAGVETGFTKEALKEFERQEVFIRKLPVYRDNKTGLYVPIDFRDVETIRKYNFIENGPEKARQEVISRFGKEIASIVLREGPDGKLLPYSERKRLFEEKFSSQLDAVRRAPTRVVDALLSLAIKMNENLERKMKISQKDDWKAIEAEFQKNLLKMNFFGNYPTSIYLKQRLNEMLSSFNGEEKDILKERIKKIESLDDFELLYKRGPASEVNRFRALLESAIAAGKFGKDLQEKLAKASTESDRASLLETAATRLMEGAGIFAHRWGASLWNTNLFFTRSKERNDFLLAAAMSEVKKHSAPHERKEQAMEKVDFGKSYYSRQLETALLMARGYDNMGGFILSKNMRGASWGDDLLGRLPGLIREAREQRGTLTALYYHLINKDSKYFDESFLKKLQEKYSEEFKRANPNATEEQVRTAVERRLQRYDRTAYVLMMERGYTFADMNRGIPFVMSSDMRGGIPLIEYDKRILKLQGKGEIVLSDKANGGKADIRDLSPLIARLAESRFANLPLGIIALSRFETPNGNVTWVYANPHKNPQVAALWKASEGNPSIRNAVGLEIAGLIYDEKTGKYIYRPDKQLVKIVSVRDFYNGLGQQHEAFGYKTQFQSFTEKWMRRPLWRFGEVIGEVMYAGLADRAEKMHQWVSSNLQVRFALDSFVRHVMYNPETGEGFMVKGKDRFAISNETLEKLKEKYGEGTINPLAQRISQLKTGDDTFLGNWNAGWYNLKRNVAAKTVIDIANAENQVYTAKLGLRAAKDLRERGEIDAETYSRLKEEFSSLKSQYKAELKEARDTFKNFRDIIVGWTGSHENAGYGSEKNPFSRNPFTRLPLLWRMFDSHWVQGQYMDFWWIAESSVMRDPRIAVGGGMGMDGALYTGYNTCLLYTS